jgi:hypothetical protein
MIFVNPEYVAYMYEVNQLKDMITDKIVERDYLIHYYCKDLKVDYMLKIGSLEYKKLLVENNVKKIKRKIELIKELEVFLEQEIDEIIKNEFADNTEIEKEMFADINIAIDYSMEENLTVNELDDLNSLYSVLVRAWNPALNMNLSDQKKSLYKEAEKAYKVGNIKLLESYSKLVEDDDAIEQGEIEDLKAAKERYNILLKENDELITTIKNTFPYNERDTLEDDNLLRRRKDKLNSETEELKEELAKLKEELNQLLK